MARRFFLAPRRTAGTLGALLALGSLGLGPRALAQPPPPANSPPQWRWGRIDLRRVAGIELQFARGPGTERLCADESTFRLGVAAECDGFDAFEPAPPDQATIPMALKSLEVAIVRQKGEVIATMDWFGSGRTLLYQREYRQPVTECDRLFRSMISSAATVILVEKTPLPEALPSPSPAPVRPEQRRPSPPPAPGDALRPLIRLGAAPLLAFEITPDVAVGVAVDVAVRWRALSLGLEGRLLFSTSHDAVSTEDVGIHTAVGAMMAVPCVHIGWFFGCGLLELGALRFTGGDGVYPKTRDPLLAAGGFRAGVEWPVGGRFAVRGFVDGATIFSRTALVYDEKEAWLTPLFYGSLGVGLTAAF